MPWPGLEAQGHRAGGPEREEERARTHDRFVSVYRQVHELIRDEVAIALQRTH